ncbi:PadR family transcriptional regulator [Virgibacillus ihumii]|uniref:PadR family transcriptional regulator n=1 Tax=Virgibacillus ihumii TaxID=2686091 RepID=UPI00157E1705|nr:PadR family transcriptional regulator [Virgibacillus ihumii]
MSDKWLFQLKKGSYELAILLLLNTRPMYGYEITQQLKDTGELSIAGGAIYPILKRMHKYKMIDFYWKESEKGPSKKYYYINNNGIRTLKARMLKYHNLYHALCSLEKKGEFNVDSKML